MFADGDVHPRLQPITLSGPYPWLSFIAATTSSSRGRNGKEVSAGSGSWASIPSDHAAAMSAATFVFSSHV